MGKRNVDNSKINTEIQLIRSEALPTKFHPGGLHDEETHIKFSEKGL